jgi:hypothetical protein
MTTFDRYWILGFCIAGLLLVAWYLWKMPAPDDDI